MAEIEIESTLFDDINEFVSDKWKRSECELCGNDRWSIYDEPLAYVLLPTGDKDGIPRGYTFPPSVTYLALNCTNCGNLRLVLKKVFDEWRAERKTTKSSG